MKGFIRTKYTNQTYEIYKTKTKKKNKKKKPPEAVVIATNLFVFASKDFLFVRICEREYCCAVMDADADAAGVPIAVVVFAVINIIVGRLFTNSLSAIFFLLFFSIALLVYLFDCRGICLSMC